MACPSNENLIRFIYEEAASKEVQEIERHIDGCETCRDEVMSIRTLDKALPEIIHAEPDGDAPDEKCPDAMTLAAYLDGSLSPKERARVEAHLARCQFCMDELVTAADRLPSAPSQYRKTPAHLLNQAIRLGAPSVPLSSTPETRGVLEKIRQWFEPLVSRPRWAFAGVGACAVVVLAVFISRQMYQGGSEIAPQRGPTIDKLAQRDEHTARPVEDVVAESKLDLSGDLKRALIDYDPKNVTESRKELFAIIEKKAPQIPVDKIENVEIEQNLLIAIASVSDLAGQVKLRLYKDGLLVISGDS
jgi:anti-sigma factor RsiW